MPFHICCSQTNFSDGNSNLCWCELIIIPRNVIHKAGPSILGYAVRKHRWLLSNTGDCNLSCWQSSIRKASNGKESIFQVPWPKLVHRPPLRIFSAPSGDQRVLGVQPDLILLARSQQHLVLGWTGTRWYTDFKFSLAIKAPWPKGTMSLTAMSTGVHVYTVKNRVLDQSGW